MATSGVAYRTIMGDLKQGIYSPIYYLMGEESFFIDSISDYIRENALSEEERDFNQIVVYGADTTMSEVVQRAKAYPMGANRQVIIVKEAQTLIKEHSGGVDPLEILGSYLQNIQPTTILVFCHKNGKLDSRKKIAGTIKQVGILFESAKIRENEMPLYINEYVREKQMTISDRATSMIIEAVGTDISRLITELDKLYVASGGNGKEITPDLVEQNVGISKEYNVFEFQRALISKDILKANKIASYYENNSKNYPIQMITATIFGYYSNLMLAFYSPNKTEQGVAEFLGLKNSWGVKDYMTGMKNYTARQVLEIIGYIREYDAKSKGIDNSGNTTDGLLRELLFKVLH